jgi:hypothetical protein
MGRTLLLILTILTITISIFASSANAQSITETVNPATPWLSIALTAAFAVLLYALVNWGDKREPYKI